MHSTPTIAVAQILTYARSKGWPDPVQEHEFHPVRGWRFDLAFVEQRIAVEIHGATHKQGRHTRGKGFEDDRQKMNEATCLGWRVFEVTYRQIAKGQLFAWLDKVMAREAA